MGLRIVNSIAGRQQLSQVGPTSDKARLAAAPPMQQQAVHRRALGGQTHLMNRLHRRGAPASP